MNNPEFQPTEILRKKEELVQSKALTIIHTYDTFKNESGRKDVSLCKNSSGGKFILRIGETRPTQFFPEGYRGEFLIIPKLIEQENIGIPFELEEFLEGMMSSEINSQAAGDGKIEPKLLEKLLSAFWEFQTIGEKVTLEQNFSTDKIIRHSQKVKGLLKNYTEIEKEIYRYQEFWNKGYPSKWKFAPDNLILTKDNKVGLIDNANVGLRYFGYDLGWLIWPLWVTMKTESYLKINEQLKYLDNFSRKVAETAPKDYSVMDSDKYFWLMILERIIGMYFDVVNNTKHLERWAIGQQGEHERTEKYLFFLETLLNHTLTRIK